ncbi:MAG: hypothetical protein LBH59_07335 [Planctomycetaceae bacterium]|nr:hypothetical protein [Planctomycetaceae bacterium]
MKLRFVKIVNGYNHSLSYTEAGMGALEQTLHVVALAVFSFLILKRLQHI